MPEAEPQPQVTLGDLAAAQELNAFKPELPSHPCPWCQKPLERAGEDLVCPDVQNCGFWEVGEARPVEES